LSHTLTSSLLMMIQNYYFLNPFKNLPDQTLKSSIRKALFFFVHKIAM